MRTSFYPYPYHILRPLGDGGIGEIYLAYHENLQKQVIIKKIKDHCKGRIDERIEVDILKNLHHQYLPQVYDFIQMDDEIYTVMDYIPGHNLDYYCKKKIVFSEEELLVWLHQLLEVLNYLHTRKPPILHCDIKPANIMITEEGNVCLIDFNISIDGESNKELIGLSSQFASPEQARKAERIMQYGSDNKIVLDARSDLYSLGAVFYFLMTGIYPNARRDNFVELKYIDHNYSDALENIISKSIQMDARKRFRSAGDMMQAVEHIEQWTTAKRKQKKVLLGMVLTGLSVSVLLSTLLIYQWEAKKKNVFFMVADDYVTKEESWDYLQKEEAETKNLLAEGIQLLNKEEYQKYFKRDKDRNYEVLYATGKCALFLREYEQAADLLGNAAENRRDDADLLRDLSLAEAGSGQTEKAKKNLYAALGNGLEETDAQLIRAEISMLNGDIENAYEMAKSVLETSCSDMEAEAVNILIKTSKDAGKIDTTVSLLEKEAQKRKGSSRMYCLRFAAKEALQIEDYDAAKRCLEGIVYDPMVLLDDLYNLDSAYEGLEKWEDSLAVLTHITKKYDHQYKAYLRMAYVCYRMNNDKRQEDRSYVQVFDWYKKAQKEMKLLGVSENSDPDMVQMKKIILQLEELGWDKEQKEKTNGT